MSDLVSFVPPTMSVAANTIGAQGSLTDNFDTFLTILTAQIQNQDPLEPMDSSRFTEQLVQFSGVEQQIRSNQLLEAVFNATMGNAGAALAGYLGQQAEIDSSGAALSDEPINWRYQLPRDAASVTVTVTDKDGKVVWSEAGEAAKGKHDFTWDGRIFNGGQAPKGVYYINVIAEDANGGQIAPAHSLLATITGVDLTHGEPALTTAAGIFAYSDILRLMRQ